jgi:hypothetical protein
MLAFQKASRKTPSAEQAARVSKWTFWTWLMVPFDVVSFLCFLLAYIS